MPRWRGTCIWGSTLVFVHVLPLSPQSSFRLAPQCLTLPTVVFCRITVSHTVMSSDYQRLYTIQGFPERTKLISAHNGELLKITQGENSVRGGTMSMQRRNIKQLCNFLSTSTCTTGMIEEEWERGGGGGTQTHRTLLPMRCDQHIWFFRSESHTVRQFWCLKEKDKRGENCAMRRKLVRVRGSIGQEQIVDENQKRSKTRYLVDFMDSTSWIFCSINKARRAHVCVWEREGEEGGGERRKREIWE